MERTILMVGSFRRGDANDPEIYTAATAKVLSKYDRDVIDYVTDPVTGMAARGDFLPTIKELRDACEARSETLAREARRQRDLLEQHRAAQLRLEDKTPKPERPNLISWRDLPPDVRPIGRFENPERKSKVA